jgi:hypothetical protein
VLAAYRDERSAEPAFGAVASARIAALKTRLADFWPLAMIASGLGLTLAWSGLLASLLWRGVAWLV